jgi:hypothetical protein
MISRGLGSVAAVSWLCLWTCDSSRAATTYQDWLFATSANPSVPAVFTNTAGVATAKIVPGYGSIGWQASLPGFGTQTGLWDLGAQNPDDRVHDTRGQIVLDIPNPVPASGNTYTDLQLRVIQFIDNFFYTGELTFSIPGAVHSGQTVIESLPPPGGKWVEDQFQWRLVPSPTPVSLTITGAVGGTLLDRIKADTVAPGGPALPLVINSVTRRSQALAITWVGGLPPYQVYASSNLLSNGSWLPVGQPVAGTNAEIPFNLSAGFVRVLGSN